MAILLAWLAWDGGAECVAWPELQARTLARAKGAAELVQGDGFQLMAMRTRALAPAAVLRLQEGVIVLRDGESFADSDDELQHPMDTPAVVVVIEAQRARVRLLRDRLGQRPLCWARVPGGVLIASGEDILRAHPAVDARLDADYLAAYFGASASPAECSAFRGIRQVAPGQRLEIHEFGEERQSLASEPLAAAFGWPDARVAQAYSEQLALAVAHSAIGSARLGLSLSGGLDSGSIAAHLSLTLAPQAFAITYGSDRLLGLDERATAARLAEDRGMQHHALSVDEAGPLSARQGAEICADSPIANPYRAIKTACYQDFAGAGVDVVLTGNFADHLNAEPQHWLRDAWRQGRLGMVASSYRQLISTRGWTGLWRDPGWRALRRAELTPVSAAPWLHPPVAVELIRRREAMLEAFRHWPRPNQAAHALGTYAAFDAAGECYFSQRHGLEVRHPYRRWALVQMALSLPAHQSWRGPVSKFAVRESLRGRLPDSWRLRPKSANMQPLFAQGLQANRIELVRLIEIGRPIWSSFVQEGAVRSALDASTPTDQQSVLLWLLAGFAQWLQSARLTTDEWPSPAANLT